SRPPAAPACSHKMGRPTGKHRQGVRCRGATPLLASNLNRRQEAEMTPQAHRGTSEVQGPLWSERADDWAEIQEPLMRPAFEAALDALPLGPDTRLLDVGCGSALARRLAADRGADVSGLDASTGLLEHA